MSSKIFLERLYVDGSIDAQISEPVVEIEADDQTRRLITSFQGIIRNYSQVASGRYESFSPEVLAELRKAGFFGLDIPQVFGGLGLNIFQYLKVVESVASLSMDIGITALAHLSIGAKGIVLFGTEEQKQKYLVPAAKGHMIFSYALTEAMHGSDAKHIETTAIMDESAGCYVLNGQKSYITNANFAGALTVFARMDPAKPGYLGAFIVETGWKGVKVGQEIPKMGLNASSTASIKFTNVKVPKSNLLGQPGDGFKIAMTILNYGRLALGAASSGIMRQALDDMVKRASQRVQFGAPIYQFQLIQEKMVRARLNSYVASAMTAFTAKLLLSNPLANVSIESSHCKLFGTTRAWDTLYDALQVAGGSGYFANQPYEKRMRDFRVATIFEGTTEIHSIYPAVSIVRILLKSWNSAGASRIIQLASAIRQIAGRVRWDFPTDSPPLRRATRRIRSLVRKIRIMVFSGFLFYRDGIFARQFFLRRITHLSMNLLGVASMAARIQAAYDAGQSIKEELNLLNLFLDQSDHDQERSYRPFPLRQERLHDRVMSDLIDQAEKKQRGENNEIHAPIDSSDQKLSSQSA
jgi:acyl-CoA dehydrogenase family protein 9